MKIDELERLLRDYHKMVNKHNELLTILIGLEEYTGVKSVSADQKNRGGQGMTYGDLIDKKEDIRSELFNLQTTINRLKFAFKILDDNEKDIITALYENGKVSVRQLEHTQAVNYYSKSQIYTIKYRALNKMLDYFNYRLANTGQTLDKKH